MIPLGPMPQVDKVMRNDILTEDQQPMLVRSPKVAAVLKRFGLDSMDGLRDEHGAEQVLMSEGGSDFLAARRLGVAAYLKKVRHDVPATAMLPESGARSFFLEHPDLYNDVARAYARLVPKGYREMLDVSSSASRAVLTTAARDHDFGVSDLALWLGGAGHVHTLRVDYVAGQFLTHLEGRKRIWLFPAAQHDLLYLGKKKGAKGWSTDDEGWGAASSVPISISDGRLEVAQPEKYPDFAKATPIAIDLQPGETMFIPCGWAHIVEYQGPAMSVSAVVHPDWLEPLLKDDPAWAPDGCRVWIREPCAEDGCGFAEL